MKKFFRVLFALALLLISAAGLMATNLTGTFKHPDGSLVNGKLIFLLSQPARLSDNSAQIVPMVKIFSISNGTLEPGAFVYGNDVLVPAGTHYVVRLVDANNNLLFEQKWQISGTSLDLGTLAPTTTGVVLADPLLRNTGTPQTVQGPVNFSSPITAYTLTLNGNVSPGVGDVFDLGNPGAPWHELYALRWNQFIRPGLQGSIVSDPLTAPNVAVEATSGGSINNSTRYYKIELVNYNGATLASPATTFTPSTCGGGACKIRVSVGGTEWKEGAFAFRVLVSSDNVNFFRQTGFPGELDTTGALANSHYVPGDVILSSLTLSGTGPAASNTATIDADQVALNSVCDRTNNICKGTLQYGANSGAGTAVQTGTTPLIVAVDGAVIRGHGYGKTLDQASQGSTRSCAFAHTKVGCVMLMEIQGSDVQGLNISSASNGYMLYKSRATGTAVARNSNTVGNAVIRTTGSLVVDGVKVDGGFYYLNFPMLQISMGTTGAGCAAFSANRAWGASWNISGKVRWTVPDDCHVFRHDTGPTDPDRAAPFQGSFLNAVGQFSVDSVEAQITARSGNKTPFKMENLFFDFNNVSTADWNPTAGTTALIEMGVTADGSGANGGSARIRNSQLEADANAASTIKVTTNAGNTIQTLKIENSTVPGSGGGSTIALDLNSVAMNVQIVGDNLLTCDPTYSAHGIANIAANTTLSCLAPHASTDNNRMANLTLTGGTTQKNPGAHGTFFQCWWPSNYECYNGDGATAGNRYYTFVVSTKQQVWYASDGTTKLLELLPAQPSIGIGRGASGANSLAFPNNWGLFGRNAANSNDLAMIKINTSDEAEIGSSSVPARFPRTNGNPPMVVDSSTEVANLNAQQWHGKQAIDFSGTLDFGSIAAQTCAELTIAATGAVANNPVASSWPAALEAGLLGAMRVSAGDTITVRLCNVTTGAIDPASHTYAGRVIK